MSKLLVAVVLMMACTVKTAVAQQSYGDIAPLVKTTWGQGAPYNEQTPLSPVTESTFDFTGSAATAMAQILKYWESRNGVDAIPAYSYYLNEEGTAYSTTHPCDDGYEVLIPSLPATTFDYDWMKDAYLPGESGAAVDAVAKLMRYCGQALETCYTQENAFATMKGTIFPQYFGFNPNIAVLSRRNYTAAEWEAIIYGELKAGRPVMYSGTAQAADGRVTHTFIIDGYHDGRFHFNWGWGGNYDGYYKLSEANPGGAGIGGSSGKGGYSIDQRALIWVQPELMVPVEGVVRPDVTGVSQLRVNSVTVDGNMRSGDLITLNVNVTNIGTLPTSNLYLMIDRELVLGIGVNMDPGSTGDVLMHFVPESEGTFQLELFGQKVFEQGNPEVGESLWRNSVTVGEERLPKLHAVGIKAVNANDEQIIGETVLQGEAIIRNDDSEFFNNRITFIIFQYSTVDNHYYSVKRTDATVRIEAGETNTIHFLFDDLESEGKYMVTAYINSELDGLEEISGSNKSPEYIIQLPSGIRCVESDCVHRDTRVFDLTGRCISSSSLPMGIYVTQGKKIVMKRCLKK